MRAVRTIVVTLGLVAAVVTALTGATAAAQVRNCGDFANRTEAQAAHDAGTAADKLRLDRDKDGIACERRDDYTVGGTPTATSFREGLYEVERDIAIGQYRTPGASAPCYSARLSDDTGAASAIIANSLSSGPRSLTVLNTDAFVEFRGPCLWTLDGATPAEPTTTTTTRATSTTTTTTTSGSSGTTSTTAPTLPPATTAPTTTTPQVSVVPIGGVATGGRAGS